MLVDANARMGRMGEGAVRSNDNGGLDVYIRETFSDNEECFFASAANYGLVW